LLPTLQEFAIKKQNLKRRCPERDDKNSRKHEIDYFDSYHLESDSRYSKQLASNKGDNKEANSRQESDSNDNLGKKWDAFYNLKDTQTDVSGQRLSLSNTLIHVAGGHGS
jgi:hypothetical protein